MQLPTKFTLGKHQYTVQPAHARKGVYGTIWYDLRHISVATKVDDKPRKSQQIAETFWHEVTHAILHDMGHKLTTDEQFVNAFSKRLTQVIYTARF